jgi:putative transposase
MPRAPAHARLCVVGVSLRPRSSLPDELEAFVGHYNHQRYHESLNNVTPADVYTGRGQTILLEREKTKRRTLKLRRLQHAKSAA